MTDHDHCHETVDVDTRDDLLEDDRHKCQICGRRGPQEGGLATLHVHHIDRDLDDGGEHDLDNLTTLCRSCHVYHHKRATPADAPVEITEADQTVLLPHDIEIVRYLVEEGPARTSDIVDALTTDHKLMAVRERLWTLMGLDNIVEERDRQLVDKDRETGEWGLTDQIDTSARGHIPDDSEELLRRVSDDLIRQAFDCGYDRTTVAEMFDIGLRTTTYAEKRAHAHDFPLAAAARRNLHLSNALCQQHATALDGTTTEDDAQLQFDTVLPSAETDPAEDGTQANIVDQSQADSDDNTSPIDSGPTDRQESASVMQSTGDEGDIETQLQQAIDALQSVKETI